MTRQEAISYMLSTHKSIAHELFGKGEFIHTLGDAHIYNNHLEQVKLQLTREPRPLPRMVLNPDVKSIFDFQYEDFQLTGYDPHPHIKGEVAI